MNDGFIEKVRPGKYVDKCKFVKTYVICKVIRLQSYQISQAEEL